MDTCKGVRVSLCRVWMRVSPTGHCVWSVSSQRRGRFRYNRTLRGWNKLRQLNWPGKLQSPAGQLRSVHTHTHLMHADMHIHMVYAHTHLQMFYVELCALLGGTYVLGVQAFHTRQQYLKKLRTLGEDYTFDLTPFIR